MKITETLIADHRRLLVVTIKNDDGAVGHLRWPTEDAIDDRMRDEIVNRVHHHVLPYIDFNKLKDESEYWSDLPAEYLQKYRKTV